MLAPLFRPILSHKMRVLLGIFLSFIFHIFLLLALEMLPLPEPLFQVRSRPIEVVILEEPSQNDTKKQFIPQTDLPQNLKAPSDEDPAKFLSAQRQRVEKETQAAVNGATKNRSNKAANPNEISEPAGGQQSRLNIDPRKPGSIPILIPEYKKWGFTKKDTPRSETPKSSKTNPSFDRGVSTIGEVLPTDIDVGSFTALNTDKHLYYTFFSRINDMIRFRWESSVRAAINDTPPDRYTYNPLGVWTTQLEVVLNKEGVIQQILLMKPSGFKGFDESAIFAFKDSKAFFNPPRELIDEETGEIHLKYSFQVNFEPKVLVRSR